MGRQVSTRAVDRVISQLAQRQHGVVSRRQLIEQEVTARQITTRLASGRLVELHRGVYLVGTVPGSHSREMAALLACGPDAVLSHRSAASLWNLASLPATAPTWVTIPPGRESRRPRIKVFRARLDRRDIRHRRRLALTSPPRTILDLAPIFGRGELEALVAEAQYRRLATDDELRDELERNPGKRGGRSLRSVLDLPGGPRHTRSPAERWLLALLRAHGIGGYETNARIHGYEVDFLWPEHCFAVEVDGYDGHSGRVAFERDRLKWARLEAAGVTVMPVSGRQVRSDPDGVAQRPIAALDRRILA